MSYGADIDVKKERMGQPFLIPDRLGPVSGGNRPNLFFYGFPHFIPGEIHASIVKAVASTGKTFAPRGKTFAPTGKTFAPRGKTFAYNREILTSSQENT